MDGRAGPPEHDGPARHPHAPAGTELIALVAPRLAFISYGNPAAGDALWLDQQGSYMATIAAGRAWTLLGAHDLGQVAWRQHDGGHSDAPNMKYFIEWADRKMARTAGR